MPRFVFTGCVETRGSVIVIVQDIFLSQCGDNIYKNINDDSDHDDDNDNYNNDNIINNNDN